MFALDVPEGLFDTTEGACQDHPSPVVGVAVQGLPQVLDAQRILPDEKRLVFQNSGFNGTGTSLNDGLAPTDDPLICRNFQKTPPWFDVKQLHSRDLQFSLLFELLFKLSG